MHGNIEKEMGPIKTVKIYPNKKINTASQESHKKPINIGIEGQQTNQNIATGKKISQAIAAFTSFTRSVGQMYPLDFFTFSCS